jgi:uncharacterized coiled-coil protein SlyX
VTALASIYVGCVVAMTLAVFFYHKKEEAAWTALKDRVIALEHENRSIKAHVTSLVEWRENVVNKTLVDCKQEVDKCQDHLARMREELQLAKASVQRHKVQVMIVDKPKPTDKTFNKIKKQLKGFEQ